jgi:hypothetical protein
MNQFYAGFTQFWSPDYYSASDGRIALASSFSESSFFGECAMEYDFSLLTHPLSNCLISSQTMATHGLLHEPCIALLSYLENPCSPIWNAELFTRGAAISLHAVTAMSLTRSNYTRSTSISSLPPFIVWVILRYSDLYVSNLTVIRNLTSNCGQERYGPENWRGSCGRSWV